jgi:hypothetical protein
MAGLFAVDGGRVETALSFLSGRQRACRKRYRDQHNGQESSRYGRSFRVSHCQPSSFFLFGAVRKPYRRDASAAIAVARACKIRHENRSIVGIRRILLTTLRYG